MSDARSEVLARVRRALDGSAAVPPVERAYRRAGSPDGRDLAALLTERLVDYRASVLTAAPADVPARLAARLAERGVTDVAVPQGFSPEWLAVVPAAHRYTDPLSVAELDALDGTVSTCAVAIAETGTIVLDAGPGQGRRALSLVPDYLLVVVRPEQVVASVPDGVAALDPTRPLTWVSGPSATSDIELQRVEGVHGPRVLDVLLVTP